ncbi:MAG: flagellar export chaperone FliS [Bryobacteraceae bacterium]|jgi:flagellar protein FliS
MTPNPYRDHLAERVLGADPVDLIVLLYEELVKSVGDARRQLAAGEPRERAQSVSRAMAILAELVQAVDAKADPGLAENLLRLYGFMLERLQAGHATQQDLPFAECERVARTLLEGWRGIRVSQVEGAAPLPDALVDTPAVSALG